MYFFDRNLLFLCQVSTDVTILKSHSFTHLVKRYGERRYSKSDEHVIYIIIPNSEVCVCVFVHVLFENG